MPMRHRLLSRLVSLALVPYCLTLGALPGSAMAQNGAIQSDQQGSYALPADNLSSSLNALARQNGLTLSVAPALVAGKRAPALTGNYTTAQALDLLLAGSGLAWTLDPQGVLILSARDGGALLLGPVRVEASGGNILPPAFAGGQVARGARLGLLGNRDLMDTPFNVTSYSAELIENQQSYSIGDVVANDPSIRNPYARGAETDEFITRGFITYNRDVAFNGLYGILPFSTIPAEIVERVEVLKGPGALLNGMPPSGTIGGNIMVMPKRAEDDPITRFTASHSARSLLGGHLDLGRRFGANQRYGARVNAVQRGGDLQFDPGHEHQGAVAGAFDYRGERMRASLDLGYQDRKLDAQQTFLFNFLIEPGVAPPEADSNWVPPWTFWNYRTAFGAGRVEFDLSDNLDAYAAFGLKHEDSASVQTIMSLRDTAGTLRATPYHQSGYQNTRSGETGVNLRFVTGGITHQAVASASLYDLDSGDLNTSASDFVFSNLYAPTAAPMPTFAPLPALFQTAGAKLQSVGIADTLGLLDDKVSLTLGLRQQRVKSESFSNTTGALVSSYDESALTPAVGLVLKPFDADLSVYFNYIEGLSQGPTAPSTAANAGEIFAPYESTQYEAGLKLDRGTFGATVGVFEIERPTGFTDPVTNRYDLDGEQRHRGLELNLFGEPVAGLRLLGGAAYTQADLTKTQNGLYQGNDAVGVPALQVNLYGEWDAPFLPGLTLSVRVIHTDRQYLNNANTQYIDSWERYDLGARYTLRINGKAVTLRANVENALDRNYWSSTSRESLYMGAPRTLLLSATIDL
ncbi:MAG TPA: TonB-dependent receptor [Hyphomicrobiales bacterium]|nr:TonB-dependent receptor [Hyphomicrobiales bacterium]